jgi:hypothetical protein
MKIVTVAVVLLILIVATFSFGITREGEILDKLLSSLNPMAKSMSALADKQDVIIKRLELMDTRLKVMDATLKPIMKMNVEMLILVKGLEEGKDKINKNDSQQESSKTTQVSSRNKD